MKTDKERKFENIVKEHKTTIYTVCYMFSKDNEQVQDLFQEVLIRIWQGIDSFDNKANIKTWIYRISLNTCISMQRKKRIKTLSLDMDINIFEDDDEDSKQIRMLYDRINLLQPFDKAIVLLWLENQSYEDISLIMGISVKNVSVRLLRIKEKLKTISND
ncbi:MAG: sigma-70 family RNA polymerase sigma factor [Bacteroidales bacterium]|nr:sigma-70 family RNA polymerase sigma factor [Bacteroidales bacterium]